MMANIITNVNRDRNARNACLKLYQSGVLPLNPDAVASPQLPYTFTEPTAFDACRAQRTAKSCFDAMRDALETRIRQSATKLRHCAGVDDPDAPASIRKDHVQIAIAAHALFALRPDAPDDASHIRAGDFMKATAIKNTCKALNIRRMCEEGKKALQNDALIFYHIVSHKANAFATAQDRAMIQGCHIQRAAASVLDDE